MSNDVSHETLVRILSNQALIIRTLSQIVSDPALVATLKGAAADNERHAKTLLAQQGRYPTAF